MARVTIEDCKVVPSRFELVLLAAQRAREISCGSKPAVDKNNKDAVLALREIAIQAVSPEDLRESILKKYQRNHGAICQEDNNIGDGFINEDMEEIQSDMRKMMSVEDLEDADLGFAEGDEEVLDETQESVYVDEEDEDL